MVSSVTLTPKPVKSSTKVKKKTPHPKTPTPKKVKFSAPVKVKTPHPKTPTPKKKNLCMKEDSKKDDKRMTGVKWCKDHSSSSGSTSSEDLKSKRLRLLNRKLAVEGTTRLYGGAKVTGVHFNYKGLTNIE